MNETNEHLSLELKENTTKIIHLLEMFTDSSIYIAMKYMGYDQTINKFYNINDITSKYITGCADFIQIPRGIIFFNKKNRILANCVDISFMINRGYIPLKYIKEIDVSEKVDTQNGTISKIIKKIYKMKRSSGEKQNCILGDNNSLFIKGFSKNSDNPDNPDKDWRIRVLFNDCLKNKNVDNTDLEKDLDHLKNNYSILYKCIKIEDFFRENNIEKITIDLSQIKKDIYDIEHEQSCTDDSDENIDYSTDESEVNNNQLRNNLYPDYIIDEEYLELSISNVVDYYFNELDNYFQTIVSSLSDIIKLEII